MKGKTKKLSTEPYKGVRDFYPTDFATREYIFDTWRQAAKRFGFSEYDASILEPAELYRQKTSEEIINEQTYTFIDRGEREVTLRPEMTPSVARLVAGRQRELVFPVRWFSIPNLFRYERPQRGRLREHWQLNCDIFGSHQFYTDVEIIWLAYKIMLAFGATPEMFTIRVNDRGLLNSHLRETVGLNDNQAASFMRLLDRRAKLSAGEFESAAYEIVSPVQFGTYLTTEAAYLSALEETSRVISTLRGLGLTNVVPDPALIRGFDYYTGTIFEFFDTNPANQRSILGGGRYDNLTANFGGEPIPGVGFGLGDVTMRDFLETHKLLPTLITAPRLAILTIADDALVPASQLADKFRSLGVDTLLDSSEKKLSKKISEAAKRGVAYVLVFGENETSAKQFTIKHLGNKSEKTGPLKTLVSVLK